MNLILKHLTCMSLLLKFIGAVTDFLFDLVHIVRCVLDKYVVWICSLKEFLIQDMLKAKGSNLPLYLLGIGLNVSELA